ncbi:triacylglycerol lipase [Ancylostoma caninum]|uniref:Triacylglycerol lipase n=1 Tax=Ancylostoma caninum TaxID=29170 RepID=A0A368G8V9_ANCCA|nr:triacylglycerol lipase [Ancylostoma caninum]
MHALLIFTYCLSTAVLSQKYGPPGPLSSHFVDWLIAHGYENDNFDRPDVGPNGSFGGKKRATEQIRNEPVIFIHGNGDAALHAQAPLATGWSRSIQYFMEQNYTEGELYATTWGDAWGTGSILDSYSTMHTCSNLLFLRRFIEAVISYTGARKVDVIAHSVGVVLARKALKGGSLIGTDGNCTLGPPLTSKIDTFVGIAGPNYGLCVCQLAQTVPAWCNALDGLYPGYTCQDQVGYSSYVTFYNEFVYLHSSYAATPLVTANKKTTPLCSRNSTTTLFERLNTSTRCGATASINAFLPPTAGHTSNVSVDEVLLFRGMTWGKPTSRIPGMNGRWVSDRNGHVAMKDLTELRQFEAVVHHSI